jgi:hypothetical protein
MPWRLAVRDRVIRASQAVDAATDPSLGGKGAFNVISARAVEEHKRQLRETPSEVSELTFGTPNIVSKRATERARGVAATYAIVPAGTFGFSVRVRRVRMLRRRLGIASAHRPVRAPNAGDMLEHSAAVAPLLEEWQSGEPRIATVRTVDYLRWRYPRFLGYHAVGEERNGALAGLAIFRVRDAGYGYREARVTELIVSQGDRRRARKLLGEVARSTSADWITCCFSPGTDAHATAARAGFKARPHKMTLLVAQLEAGIDPNPTELDSWALTLGEVEQLI